MSELTAVSLFTSGGIGDLALRAAGLDILVSNELLVDRHELFRHNFPKTLAIQGDIRVRAGEIETAARRGVGTSALTMLYATPPCQGMSKNGRGKLLSEVRAGRKPAMDERNRLIIPTIELAASLRPEIVLLENVPEMADTIILGANSEVVPILDLIKAGLGPEYVGRAEVVEFADFGVPQRRQRLISIFARHPALVEWFEAAGTFLPERTHSSHGRRGTRRWVTVRDAIEAMPPLDASREELARSEIPFHRVPTLDAMKYWWVKHTRAERSAFDNQCVDCAWDGNPTHGATRDAAGVNRASRRTPLYCERCGALLPRPHVESDGKYELMKGFTSAYKRMSYDKPASALTRNLSYACSDNKLHPVQNRVLSLHEAFRLHTLDQYAYEWKRRDGKTVSDKLVREVVGESIPPLGLQRIVDHLLAIRAGIATPPLVESDAPLFARR